MSVSIFIVHRRLCCCRFLFCAGSRLARHSVSCLDIPMTISSVMVEKYGTELPLTICPKMELTSERVDHYFSLFKANYGKVYEHAKEEVRRNDEQKNRFILVVTLSYISPP